MRYLLRFLLCSFVAVSIFSVVRVLDVDAQTDEIDLLIPIADTLAVGATDIFTFRAQTGALLSFVAEGRGGFDPIIEIADASGAILLSNDDYAYPDSVDAVIEGFVVPTSGRYEVRVRGYSSVGGDYRLSMLPGYSDTAIADAFDMASDWEAISTDVIDEASLSIADGRANLTQVGFNRTGLAIGVIPDGETYYVHTTVSDIQNVQGWRAGIVLGYLDENNYHRLLVNYRGAWQLTAIRNGEEVTVRDWSIHPQIPPNNTAFTLGVLVNETTFDAFYNGQFIGSAENAGFQGGQVGLIAETVETMQGDVTVQFEDVTITRPMLVDGSPIFPHQIIASSTNATVRELRQRLLVPARGEMRLMLTESFVSNNQVGVTRFAVGEPATQFAVGTQVWWSTTDAFVTACGLVVRDTNDEEYVLAYADSAGGSGLSERSGADFVQNVFSVQEEAAPPHNMVVIVRGEQVDYFLNGQHRGRLEIAVREGNVAEASINFQEASTSCQFSDTWIWQWE